MLHFPKNNAQTKEKNGEITWKIGELPPPFSPYTAGGDGKNNDPVLSFCHEYLHPVWHQTKARNSSHDERINDPGRKPQAVACSAATCFMAASCQLPGDLPRYAARTNIESS